MSDLDLDKPLAELFPNPVPLSPHHLISSSPSSPLDNRIWHDLTSHNLAAQKHVSMCQSDSLAHCPCSGATRQFSNSGAGEKATGRRVAQGGCRTQVANILVILITFITL